MGTLKPSIACCIPVEADTPITSRAWRIARDNTQAGTLQIGRNPVEVSLYLGPPEIDRMITALEDLRQKVAELAKEGEGDA